MIETLYKSLSNIGTNYCKKYSKYELVTYNKWTGNRIYKTKINNNEIIIKVVNKYITISNLIRINKMMLNHKIPNLYNNIYFIQKCNNNILMGIKYYPIQLWDIIDNNNIDKTRSVLIQILSAVWHLNHKLKLYFGDIVDTRGKKGVILHNVMIDDYNRGKNKTINFGKFGKVTFLHNNLITKLIDLESCISLDNKKYMSSFYKRTIFSTLNFKSEILYIIWGLLKYYKFEKVNSRLMKWLKDNILTDNISMNEFDFLIIKNLNQNFKSFMNIFDEDYPKGFKIIY